MPVEIARWNAEVCGGLETLGIVRGRIYWRVRWVWAFWACAFVCLTPISHLSILTTVYYTNVRVIFLPMFRLLYKWWESTEHAVLIEKYYPLGTGLIGNTVRKKKCAGNSTPLCYLSWRITSHQHILSLDFGFSSLVHGRLGFAAILEGAFFTAIWGDMLPISLVFSSSHFVWRILAVLLFLCMYYGVHGTW
jgi:hypothetical protein